MTDSRLSFTARAIILLLGLSLLVMLGVTIKERVSNPHLVTERPTAPQGMGQEQNLLASLMQKVAAEFDKKENRTGTNAPTFQFMRMGYFCLDNRDSSAEHLVFNRSVSLKDSFKK